jgi:cell division protein FtsA
VIEARKEIAVLDIGTSKICCTIAKKDPKLNSFELIDENRIRVIGFGHQLARGIKRGAITNLEDLEDSILNAIASTEKDIMKSVKSVLIALPSWALCSNYIQTSIPLGQLPVDDIHVMSLLNPDTSKYIDLTSRKIIHMFPTTYSIDDAHGIQDPIGMVGDTLSTLIHVVTAPVTLIKNIKNCLNRNNIFVEGFVSSSYASSLSVLLPEEMSSGATVIDFGGSTTTIAFFQDNALLHMNSIPVGSHNITNDISIILRTATTHAERLKILYGVTSGDILSSHEEQCLIPRIDEYGEEHVQNVSRGMLDSIIGSRLGEIFELIQQRINRSGADSSITQRVIITGGGSRISGLFEFIKAKRYLGGSSVRLGKPISVTGSNDFVQTSSFSTCAGSVVYFLNDKIDKMPKTKRSLRQKIITWFKRGI